MRMRVKILIFGEIAAAGTSKFVYANDNVYEVESSGRWTPEKMSEERYHAYFKPYMYGRIILSKDLRADNS